MRLQTGPDRRPLPTDQPAIHPHVRTFNVQLRSVADVAALSLGSPSYMNRHISCIYGTSYDNWDGNFGLSPAKPFLHEA